MVFRILLYVAVVAMATSQNCTFPKWLITLSPWDHEWRTDLIVSKGLVPNINEYLETATYVDLYRDNTLTITKHSKKDYRRDKQEYNCFKDLGKGRFVMKRKSSELYRCVEFYERSRFVAQWRLGEEESTNTNCPGDFAPVSDWPLVYWPLMRSSGLDKINQAWDMLQEYPSCPALGGFEIRVNASHGDELFNRCPNDYPSPRMEFECGAGEGIVFTYSRGYCHYIRGSTYDIGARLYCLATWEEGLYTYSVLVPTDYDVHSFHCLRINTDDPTSEPAILFLDNVCRSGDPDPSREAFLTLDLRRTPLNGFCDDYSDQCQEENMSCDVMEQRNACSKTCDSCPDVNGTVSFDSEIQGTWILQKGNVQQEIQINGKKIAFPGLGTFEAYSDTIDKTCINTEAVFKEGLAFEYVLGQTQKTCLPRVMQFRMTKISSSVALIAMPGTAPLRNKKYVQTSSQWCWNNEQEYDLRNRVFHPYWPLVTSALFNSYDSDWYTLVQKGAQTHVNCRSKYFGRVDGKVKLNLPSCKGCTCQGILQSVSDTEWSFSYTQCTNDLSSKEIKFTCLADYEASRDYKAMVVKPTEPIDVWGSDLKYFTIMYPQSQYKNKYPIVLTTAGEGDFHYAYRVITMAGKPLVRMEPDQFYVSGGDSMFRSPVAYAVLISSLLASFIFMYL